jgi:hypothetical protein
VATDALLQDLRHRKAMVNILHSKATADRHQGLRRHRAMANIRLSKATVGLLRDLRQVTTARGLLKVLLQGNTCRHTVARHQVLLRSISMLTVTLSNAQATLPMLVAARLRHLELNNSDTEPQVAILSSTRTVLVNARLS